jgi:choice-of-anchor C domain-containing protein
MQRISLVMATAAVLLGLAGQCQAGFINNGGFETGSFPGSATTLFNGSTGITGWVVGGNSVDYIGSHWQAGEGSRSVDLSGSSPGSISQPLSGLTVGKQYQVSFLMAGNPDGGPSTKVLNASVGSFSQNFTFNVASKSLGNMGWTLKSFTFTATSATPTLTFSSLTEGPYGPAIDGVRVGAMVRGVPEPGSLALLGLGAAGLALASWRRRKGYEPSPSV